MPICPPKVVEALCFKFIRPYVRPSVHPVNTFINQLWKEFHQIYNCGALADKNEQVRF